MLRVLASYDIHIFHVCMILLVQICESTTLLRLNYTSRSRLDFMSSFCSRCQPPPLGTRPASLLVNARHDGKGDVFVSVIAWEFIWESSLLPLEDVLVSCGEGLSLSLILLILF